MKKSLLILAKNPTLGTVKTRLAATVGNIKALKIYNQLLRYTYEITKSVCAKKYIFYSNFVDLNDFWGTQYLKEKQEGYLLGDRIRNALHNVNSSKMVLIGSDCAQLTTQIIENAFEKLSNYDVVIGPAEDGGYYLIGVKSDYDYLFENMPWSEPQLLKKTLDKIVAKQKSYFLLPTLLDLDDETDLKKIGWD